MRISCAGTTGTNCELDSFNECSSNPCMNNAKCYDFFGDFACDCTPQWSGKKCDIYDPKSKGGLGRSPTKQVCSGK